MFARSVDSADVPHAFSMAAMADQHVRANYGASLSPDGTIFAHIVDDGGYPRAVQRFLHDRRTGGHLSLPEDSSRGVVLPIDGPVSRVIHSPDGHWLACEVASEGGTVKQIWLVTTDPEDLSAWRIDRQDNSTAELIGWSGRWVAAVLTADNGIGASCLIDPSNGDTVVLDERCGARLIDAWAGAALVRVGPRCQYELVLLHGLIETSLLPTDPGSTTAAGVILDDHQPRRIRSGPAGEEMKRHRPHKFYEFDSPDGYVRALICSDHGGNHARLLEVTATKDGMAAPCATSDSTTTGTRSRSGRTGRL